MRGLTRRLLLGACAAMAVGRFVEPARSQVVTVPYRPLVLRIAREFVVPRTEVLAKAAAAQATAWDAFVAAPDPAALPVLEAAFQATADAWSGIEAVRFGPIGDDFRYDRMAHWPEQRGAVGKAIAGLLAGSDAIAPERLRRGSVAGQGLSALERLLWGEMEGATETVRRDLLETSPAGERRRALGRAIAANLRVMTAETLNGWTGSDGQLATLGQTNPEEARYALTRLVTDHLAQLHVVADAKIGAVLGRSPDEARPLLAEGWRSGRSLRAIRLNLDAADSFDRAVLPRGSEPLRSVLAALDPARAQAAELAADAATLSELAADPERRARLVALREAVLSARDRTSPVLADALLITIGFNSSDGD